ncbi:universal stress protein [Mycolicibacterium litorale]|uniref:Universal stress protein n=1 Tax=Mycolicibacterium litorale TaxID=758802 RepID=A0AAD1II57_9MYCO|nr:universal stress protein [Mycolicibacterium litorale]MCV7414495.1 universal stress protein [Mycolicibacterium litorale]TDY01481.1 nucleotide-binding universal stress UspA family protein [Mycolicibacterium litorale]BBY15306.1 universal stress protein [Mycolicibacterium litorale]
MTIVAGFSASRQGSAPLHLAAELARCTFDRIIAAAIVERPWPPRDDPVEKEYLHYLTLQVRTSLERVVGEMSGDVETSVVVHKSASVPEGLTELATHHRAEAVVVGSSSSGLLGRVALGSVTDRLVHTAAVPVAIAPRGYPTSREPIRRLTVAYGGHADAVRLIETAVELAVRWSVRLRIASFSVRPVAVFGGSFEPSAESLVVEQWSKRTEEEVTRQLDDIRARIATPDVDVVVGVSHDWREAVENVAWEPGDLLLLGSGAAGPSAQVFLGSAAAKILRHSPVPVMIVPKR